MTTLLARSRRIGWLALLVAGCLGIAAFYALPADSFEQSIAYDVIGVLATVGIGVAVLLHRPRGAAVWLLLLAGQAAFVVGDLLWTTFSALGEDPFPSIADVAYLAGYPLMGVGLALAVGRRVAGGDRAGVLDAAILTTGAGVLWWSLVLGPVALTQDPDPVSFAVSVAYPLADLILIGVALALVVTPGAKGMSFRLLLVSLVAVLLGDLGFGIQSLEGTYADGGLLDGLWLLGYIVLASAALHPSMVDLVEPQPVPVTLLGPVRLGLLGLAMLVGPALLFTERATGDAVVAVVAGATALLSALVLTRLGTMVRHLARDIERRAVLEQQLAYQAYHDPLTGLANRRRFIAAVNESIAGPGMIAALFLDLDDFKHVNDDMGHDAGDALLLSVGERLLATVREGDLVGRLGGDEFAILLGRVSSPAEAEAIASRLLERLEPPVDIEGAALRVAASVGVAVRAPGDPADVDELIRRADVAMYHAKARGKNRWTTFVPQMDAGDSTVRVPSRGASSAA